MSTGKLVGGILALAAGSLALIGALIWVIKGTSISNPIILVNLALSGVVIVGGILGITGKKAGGILALIGGSLWIVGGILAVTEVTYYLLPLGTIFFLIPTTITYLLSIEAIIAVVGGIIILASGE